MTDAALQPDTRSLLLTWHGHVVCRNESGCLVPGSLDAVAAGHMRPLLVGNDGRLVDPPPFVETVPPAASAPVSSLGLMCGLQYVSCIDQPHFGLADILNFWEHFLPVALHQLSALALFIAHEWCGYGDQPIRPHLAELTIRLEGTAISPADIMYDTGSQTVTLPTGDVLKRWPDQKACRALNAVAAIDLAEIGHEKTRHDLTRQAALTFTRVHEPAHLYFLAHVCVRAGLPEPARLCLEALEGLMPEADRLWAASIVAACTTNRQEESRILLDRAIKALLRAQGKPVDLAPGYEDLQSNGPPHLAARRQTRSPGTNGFATLFDTFIFPAHLPGSADKTARTAYFHALEDRWLYCAKEERSTLIAREEDINGPSHVLSLMKGHDAWLRGERDEADRHYGTARVQSLADGLPFFHYNCGVYSWLPRDTCDTLGSASGITQIPDRFGLDAWTWYHAPDNGVPADLCFVGGSDGYYFRFIPGLIASLIHACEQPSTVGPVHCVLGLAQPLPGQIAFLTAVSQALTARNHRLRLSFAWGQMHPADGATFTCIRYLLLPEIVRRTECPVMTADVDGVFPVNFLDLFQTMQSTADYGFRLYAYDETGHQTIGEPWGFGATMTYFGDPLRLPYLASFLRDYINIAYDIANTTNWCIDQCALSAMYRRFLAPHWNSLRIKYMDKGEPLMIMPHHLDVSKSAFLCRTDLVDKDRIFGSLGLDPSLMTGFRS